MNMVNIPAYSNVQGEKMSMFETLDQRFNDLVKASARVEKLYEGCRWAEGPAYLPAGRYLVWSDIPNDRMLRFDETTGTVGVFRHPAAHSNGNTVDREGRLVTCEHGNRRVTRTEHDGGITVLADRFEGKRLNSPNDVVVASDGAVWFTDPTYGIDSDYEGHKAASEIGACHLYRVDPSSGACRIAADDFVRPNGLAFSPDESRLYVSDTGASHVPDGPRHIRAFAVGEGGRLSGCEVFATCTVGKFDGFRFDDAGRLWTSAGDGVHCYAPDGTLIGKVLVPETVANVVFGGIKRNRLFICATTSLYAVLLPVNGAKTF
jgi:gluconolactonase